MSEKKTEVKAFSIDYTCDVCHQGQMRPTGMVFDTYPALYPHRCNKCDAAGTFDIIYPTIRYEPVV